MNEKIDKSKFKLVEREDFRFDEEFKTKPIGYYKDAWLRFKKNKASVIASIIMSFLVFMAIIGPWIRTDTLYEENTLHALKLVSQGEMPPKIKGLEWIPAFNGHRNISRSNLEIDLRPLEDEAIVERFGKIIYTDLDTVEPSAGGVYSVEVDFYNYVNYKLSMAPMNLTTEELQAIYDYEAETGETLLLEENRVWKNPDGSLVEGQSHRVTINYFDFLEVVYDYEPNYWFGADQRGRDWFSVLWNGARISLLIAFTVSIVNIIIERLSEIISGIPFLALITLLILRYGSSVGVVIIAFTLTGWLGISAVTRTQFYRYKNREYVLAARTLGASDIRIMYRHVLPNAVGTLITSFVLYIPSVIFSESTFSYLGIINYGDVTSVGRMLADAQTRLKVDKSLGFLVMYPALFVSFLMLSFNLFGNGLRDAFNPSLRGVEE
jgi:oligopeptide transport system permease protein